MVNSLYLHIPFCQSICTYCDFCKMYYDEMQANKYLNALKKEIDNYYQNDLLKTIYIGGGTPSCLKIKQLERLLSLIDKLNLDMEYEFTFECNIEHISKTLLEILKKHRVNRLSIGIETFNDEILKLLGRNYSSDIINKRIELAKKYFSNINIDLIYGINGQTLDDLKDELNKFLDLDIPHISIYSLILEENTILKVKNYKEIDEDLNRDMYDYIVNVLENNGYIHYEISNFSKKSYESKHNLTYWNNDKYYGFGLGASGYLNNYRYTNTRSLTKYLKDEYIYDKEIMTKKIEMENYMILGLRKICGVSKSVFKYRYGYEIKDIFDISKLEEEGDYYKLRKEDIYISNYILEDFIDIEGNYE